MQKKICMRCRGRKKMYKINSAYSVLDTGGVLVDCPLCTGDGFIDPSKTVESTINELEKEVRECEQKLLKTEMEEKELKTKMKIEQNKSKKKTPKLKLQKSKLSEIRTV